MYKRRIVALLVFGYYFGVYADTHIKYEVILENLTECEYPQPPYQAKRSMIFEGKKYIHKGKTLVSGRTTVRAEVPFQNLSSSSYVMEQGRWNQKRFAEKLKCRSFLSQVFMTFGNFRFNKNTCNILKGTYYFKDVDLDKIFHGIPNWHAQGSILHRTSLTVDMKTVFCVDVVVSVKNTA